MVQNKTSSNEDCDSTGAGFVTNGEVETLLTSDMELFREANVFFFEVSIVMFVLGHSPFAAMSHKIPPLSRGKMLLYFNSHEANDLKKRN